MTAKGRTSSLGVCSATLTIASLVAPAAFGADPPKGAPIPPPPPFTSPDIKPTLCDFLFAKPMALAKKIRGTDPLQRPPFADAPPDSLKGMAAGIRAVQLDAPNRAAAAAYLGTVDCVTYPQAQEMLIATMHADPSEEVRFEAVMALRAMLSNGCTNLDTECQCQRCENIKKTVKDTERHSEKAQKELIKDAHGPAKKLAKQVARKDDKIEKRYDCCRGCCNAKVLNALAKTAYDKDAECCWFEPSERIREAAKEGLCLCQATPGYAPPATTQPPSTPPVEPDGETGPPTDGEVKPMDDAGIEPDLEVVPKPDDEEEIKRKKAAEEGTPPEANRYPRVPGPALGAKAGAPTIPALKNYCVVSLKNREFKPGNKAFSSVHENRTYYFSSAAAKAKFDAAPADYAIQYRGCDPVEWRATNAAVPGEFLREFDGQFYMFTCKEHWDAFKAAPERYVANYGKTAKGNVRTVSSR